MTETSILPISSDHASPPTGGDYSGDDGGAAGANRRKLFIAGGVAGVVVVAVAAFMLLHGGSSAPSTSSAVVPHGTFTQPAAAPPAGPSNGGGATTRLPKKSKAQAGRNPFTPLFTAPVDAGTPVGSTTVAPVAPTPVASTPVGPVTPVAPPSTPPSTPPSNPPALGAPTFLQLLSTHGTKSATFKVGFRDNKFQKFTVLSPKGNSSTGTVFGTEFALLGISDHQATVQIGDSTPFDLAKGVVRQL
jgi:hypothetical protein